MKRSAAVAVIGGGVIGASVAYHLAKNGVRDIVVIDRGDSPGSGSTGKATGGFRAQFATPVNIRLSLLSRDKLAGFRDETGVDPGYDPVGYLWLASRDSHLEALAAARRIQHAEGLFEAAEVSVNEIAKLNPHVSTDGIAGGAFCLSDGYIRPLEILRGYLEAGARLGVETYWNVECTSVGVANRRVRRVSTSLGDIEAETVVNAAGPWAAVVAAMAGVELPVTPLRRQAAVTEPTSALPDDMPMTIFMDTGFHLRSRDGRGLLCWPSPDDSGRSDVEVDEDWIGTVTGMMRERVPALRDAKIDRGRCYAGLYEMSADHHAIVGYAAECGNMFLVNGSSGHGVMHSPALGEISADLICGRAPVIDVTPLRPSRFSEGATGDSAELL